MSFIFIYLLLFGGKNCDRCKLKKYTMPSSGGSRVVLAPLALLLALLSAAPVSAVLGSAECGIYDDLADMAGAQPGPAAGASGHRRRSLVAAAGGLNSTTNATAARHDAGHAGHAVHASAQEVGFLTLCIFLGVVARMWIVPKICCGFMPYTVCLILMGTGIGGLQIITQFDDSKAVLSPWCHLPTTFNKSTGAMGGCDVSQICNEATGAHCECACTSWFDYLNVNTLSNISPHVILYGELSPFI